MVFEVVGDALAGDDQVTGLELVDQACQTLRSAPLASRGVSDTVMVIVDVLPSVSSDGNQRGRHVGISGSDVERV